MAPQFAAGGRCELLFFYRGLQWQLRLERRCPPHRRSRRWEHRRHRKRLSL